MPDSLFVLLQYLVPQHLISRVAGAVARCRWAPVKNTFIRWFIGRYQVDLSQAQIQDPKAFACFNDFFTRALKPDARPLAVGPGSILCPADGTLSQAGGIEYDQLLQAKGRHFSLIDLLGGNSTMAEYFQGGSFATVYLSPRDYHRVHMPLGGTLLETLYVPGRLFSVNQVTADGVPGLFARNERLICLFQTDYGKMAVILVGAMIVAGIDTVWDGQASPANHGLKISDYRDRVPAIQLAKGEEMGRFRLGSTAIVLFEPDTAEWSTALEPGSSVRMGEGIGQLRLN